MKNKLKLGFLVLVLLVGTNNLMVSHNSYAKEKKIKSGKHLWDYKRQFKNNQKMNEEIKVGSYYMDKQVHHFKNKKIGVDLPKHAALRARIIRIVNRIAKVSDMPDFPYEVHVFDMPKVVNAFCLPGGKIGVFSGLFDSQKGLVHMNSDDEIAAVIAHEIAHATLRHATRRMNNAQGIGILGSIASIAIGAGAGGVAQGIFDTVFSFGADLIMPNYSRKQEKEADRVGFYYMSKAGFNPNAAIRIWENAAKRKDKGDKTDAFSSHPSDGTRAKELKKWLPDAMAIYKKEINP